MIPKYPHITIRLTEQDGNSFGLNNPIMLRHSRFGGDSGAR